MTDYSALLSEARRKLCQIRDRRKAMQEMSHDQFYYSVAEVLRMRFGVRVSFGWVRAQCLEETDPSFLRFGALLNFLEDYDEDGVRVGEAVSTEDASGVEYPQEDVPDLDNINPYFEELRREHLAQKASRNRRR
jgi:hypothetical protein